MAYEYDPNLDPDEQKKQQDAQSGGADQSTGTNISGGGAPVAGQAANSSGTQAKMPEGQYTNLQDYLSANQDQHFGSQMAGKVQGDVDTATNAQKSAGTDFQGQVDKGTTQYNSDLVNSAANDSTNFVKDQGNVDAYNAQKNATYSGPNDFASDGDLYGSTQQATANAQNSANASKTEGGRFALLDQYFGRPSYSQGEKGLDNFLVQGDDQAQPAFQAAQEGANQATKGFGDLSTSLDAYAKQGQDTTAATAKQATDTVNNAQTGFESGLTQRQQDLANQQAQAYQAQKDAFAQGKVGNSGVMSGANYWNLDPSSYITQETGPTTSSVSTQDDAARLAALQQLSGNQDMSLDASQVGTYDPTKAVGFDMSRFTGDSASAEAAYNNQMNQSAGSNIDANGQFLGGNAGDTWAQRQAQDSQDASREAAGVGGPGAHTYSDANNRFNTLLQAMQKQYGYGNKLY